MNTLPTAFVEQMRALLGDTEAGALCRSLSDTTPPTSLRYNPLKPTTALPQGAPVPWCNSGIYLAERPSFTLDPLFHAGCYYVQEAASMFIAQAYRTIAQHFQPQRLLDLCAAPGGKSTLWRALLPHDALLVANEPIKQRAQILAENLTKWGQPHTVVSNAYPEAFGSLGSFFDVVAADVPCSGEGMFRKDQQARTEWSPTAVTACVDRQREILESVWPVLREGGFLVYSTCTFNREENEDNVLWACRTLGAELVEITLPTAAWGIAGDSTGQGLPVYHFYPHRTEGEGLFLALLRKTSAAPALRSDKKARGKGKDKGGVSAATASTLRQWLTAGENFVLLNTSESCISALPEANASDMLRLWQTLHCLTVGLPLAKEKGRKLIPSPALALSVARCAEAFPTVELTREMALAFLRSEALVLPLEVPRGYVVVTYEGQALGFVNHLGTRANNLYPNEWRIRKALS